MKIESKAVRWGIYGLFSLMLLMLIFPHVIVVFEFVLLLLSGWATYPLEVLPKLRTNAALIALGAVCGAGFVAGWHLLLRLWRGAEWRVKYSLLTAGLVLAGFVAGIAAIGTVHQVSWLATTRESWIINGDPGRISSRALSYCRHIAEEAREIASEEQALEYCRFKVSQIVVRDGRFQMAPAVDAEGRWAAIVAQVSSDVSEKPVVVAPRRGEERALPTFQSLEEALAFFARPTPVQSGQSGQSGSAVNPGQ